MKLTIGHTPDTDDAFILHGMLAGKVDCEGLQFEEILAPIARLNALAAGSPSKRPHVTAASVGALPRLVSTYEVLDAGACAASLIGRSSPLLVLGNDIGLRDFEDARHGRRTEPTVAVPSFTATACVAAHILVGGFRPVVERFDRILGAVLAGRVDGGVLISEDQMRAARSGLRCIDLAAKWYQWLGVPLFLGVDVVRLDLPQEVRQAVGRVLRRSVEYAVSHEEEALDAAMVFSRGTRRQTVRGFVRSYVGPLTVSMRDEGRTAIMKFLLAAEAGRLLRPASGKLRFAACGGAAAGEKEDR